MPHRSDDRREGEPFLGHGGGSSQNRTMLHRYRARRRLGRRLHGTHRPTRGGAHRGKLRPCAGKGAPRGASQGGTRRRRGGSEYSRKGKRACWRPRGKMTMNETAGFMAMKGAGYYSKATTGARDVINLAIPLIIGA